MTKIGLDNKISFYEELGGEHLKSYGVSRSER